MKKSKLLMIITIIILVINLFTYLVFRENETLIMYISDILPIICSFIAVYFLFMTVKKFKSFDFAKKAWLLFLVGMLLYFIAETIYAFLEIRFDMDMDENFPSAADFFWGVGYIPLFTAMLLMLIGYKKSGFPMGNIKLYTILSILLTIISIVVFYFILLPVIQDPETTGLTAFFSLLYPVGDVLLVIPAVILMYITSLFGTGKISFPWRFLALGFISFTIADLLYSYLSWQGAYGNGNLIDLAWHLGYLLIGIAGVYQAELIESIKMEG